MITLILINLSFFTYLLFLYFYLTCSFLLSHKFVLLKSLLFCLFVIFIFLICILSSVAAVRTALNSHFPISHSLVPSIPLSNFSFALCKSSSLLSTLFIPSLQQRSCRPYRSFVPSYLRSLPSSFLSFIPSLLICSTED